MEAPDKIFICDYGSEFGYEWHSESELEKGYNYIEYVRKDAFIEKACQFIKEHHHEFSFWNTEEYELGFSTQKFIENFKKYMEV